MRKFIAVLEMFLQFLIFYSLINYFLELEYAGTENSREGYLFFLWSERVVAGIFTIEYLFRWFFAKERWKYLTSPMGLVDLVAVVPFYVGFFVPAQYLRLIRTLRILRLFKIYRYNDALRSFVTSFATIKKELQIIGVAILVLVFMSATAEYEFERVAQPEMFAKYSDALWWSLITLTTVGYGDMFPVTVGGRVTALVTLALGLGIFGTFLSLIGSAFMSTLYKGTVSVTETTQVMLKRIQGKRGLPDDEDSLRDLVGDIVAAYCKNHEGETTIPRTEAHQKVIDDIRNTKVVKGD
jgi:voltage-gated potassium channel